jgi:hypothetical protein
MQKIRGDKPIGIIIYTLIENSQGIFLYLRLKSHVLSFLFFLLQNQRIRG